MNRSLKVLSMVLLASPLLWAQVPNPLNLPDPLGISKPNKSEPAPDRRAPDREGRRGERRHDEGHHRRRDRDQDRHQDKDRDRHEDHEKKHGD